MTLMDAIRNLRMKAKNVQPTTHRGLDGDTEDKRLLTLRKMRRKQMEEEEKKRLLRDIKAYNDRVDKTMWTGGPYFTPSKKRGRVGKDYFKRGRI